MTVDYCWMFFMTDLVLALLWQHFNNTVAIPNEDKRVFHIHSLFGVLLMVTAKGI